MPRSAATTSGLVASVRSRRNRTGTFSLTSRSIDLVGVPAAEEDRPQAELGGEVEGAVDLVARCRRRGRPASCGRGRGRAPRGRGRPAAACRRRRRRGRRRAVSDGGCGVEEQLPGVGDGAHQGARVAGAAGAAEGEVLGRRAGQDGLARGRAGQADQGALAGEDAALGGDEPGGDADAPPAVDRVGLGLEGGADLEVGRESPCGCRAWWRPGRCRPGPRPPRRRRRSCAAWRRSRGWSPASTKPG